jgi:hypothetical protein
MCHLNFECFSKNIFTIGFPKRVIMVGPAGQNDEYRSRGGRESLSLAEGSLIPE